MCDLLRVEDVHSGSRACDVEALAVIGHGAGVQAVHLGGLRGARAPPLVCQLMVVNEPTGGVEARRVRPFVADGPANIFERKGREEQRVLEDFAGLFICDRRDYQILILRPICLRENEQPVGIAGVMPQIKLVRENAFGLGPVVDWQTRPGIERVGDHIAAGSRGSAANHEHALDTVGRGVVVRAQLPVAHCGLAVINSHLRHRADFDRWILFRIGLDFENLDIERDPFAGGIGRVAAAPIQTVAGNAEPR